MSKIKIGLMGGTFDPVHYGHMVTAEAARYEFQLDKVIFVPSGHPPHKAGSPVTGAEHRYFMTALAVTSNPNFEVSKVEIDRVGPSYTVDTIKYFLDQYHGEAEVYFITGVDAIREILTWRKVEDLLELCYFIAATRPGYQLWEMHQRLSVLLSHQLERIKTMEVPALAISSTDIRNRVRKGRPIKYLLPELVESYIIKNKLYL
ncbi:MAG: nicotinate-nucleotide adenylyltransferase [Clostridia bacterium]|nr:nicotinate-nucleotide adenylyltransferase [Clostridia bacterium]